MIDVRRYLRSTLGSNDISYPFGSPTKEGMATEIRRFADDVESGKILVQRIQCAEVLDISDYTMSCLFVEYAEGIARTAMEAHPLDEHQRLANELAAVKATSE